MSQSAGALRVVRRILTGLLREELGFEGVIVTDALDMAGASGQIGIPAAAQCCTSKAAAIRARSSPTPNRPASPPRSSPARDS